MNASSWRWLGLRGALATLAVIMVLGIYYYSTPNQVRITPAVKACNDILEEIIKPDVAICRNGDQIVGSGVVIDQDVKKNVAHIITCYHVAEYFQQKNIALSVYKKLGEQEYQAHGVILWGNSGTDLALIETTAIWPGVARMLRREQLDYLAAGMQVILCGHPCDRADEIKNTCTIEPHLTEGLISSLSDPGHDGLLRMSAPIFYGNSGGAVYTKIDGHWALISIGSQIAIPFGMPLPHISYGCSPRELLDFMQVYEAFHN